MGRGNQHAHGRLEDQHEESRWARVKWFRTRVVSILASAAVVAAAAVATVPIAAAAEEPATTETTSADDPAVTTTQEAAPSAPATVDPVPTPTPEAPPATTPPEQTASPEPTQPPEETQAPEETQSPTPTPTTDESTLKPTPTPTPSKRASLATATATITVKVGSDRVGTSGVTNLAGVTLQLYPGGSGGPGTNPYPGAWTTCVSDATGTCTFTVPDVDVNMTGNQSGTNGGNKGRQFWIQATGAPTGWFLNKTLAVGGSPSSTAYTFRTPAMALNGVYSSTLNFMVLDDDDDNASSGGIWQVSRNNVTLPATCGVDVALLVDLSGSLSAELSNVKSAAKAVVDSLEGTDSRIGVYTFSDTAPSSSGGNLAMTQVATAAGATIVRNHINGFSTPDGSTNWDRAFSQIPTGTYEAVVIITDGNPTTYGADEGPGDRTRFVEIENAVFSANQLKANGTRIIALGVGSGVGGPADNLKAISGQTLGSDYFQSATFDAAKTELRKFALGDCLGSVSVVKQVVPGTNVGESKTGATPAGGWSFTAASQTPGVSVTGPATQNTAAGTGAVTFPLSYVSGTNSGVVQLTETQQPGYSIVTTSSKNAVCVARKLDGSESNVTVTNTGTAAAPGFTVNVPSSSAVTCTVYNREPLPTTSMTVNKFWSINGGPVVANNENPLAAQGLTANLTVNGTSQPWGTPRVNLNVGSSVPINESMNIPAGLDLCVVTSVQVKNAAGAIVATSLPYSPTIVPSAATNTYSVTNSVTCTSNLTLTKQVVGGNATANLWTLAAQAPGGAMSYAPGATGVTHPVTPGASYTLSESGGSALYVLTGWTCSQVDAQGNVLAAVSSANSTVSAAMGTRVRCTARNETASLSLNKLVVNDNGGAVDPSAFALTATPATLAGLFTTTVPGATTPSGANTFLVRPNHVYTLTEAGVPGYTNTSLQRFVGGSWVTVVDANDGSYPRLNASGQWEVKVGPSETGTYRFVNDDSAPKLTLRKVVVTDNGGTAIAGEWTLTATTPGGPNLSVTTGQGGAVKAGVTYTLGESGPAGYALTGLTCDSGKTSTSTTNKTVTLNPGEEVTCTFTNDDIAPKLTLAKVVVNDDGGTKVPTDWNGKLIATLGSASTYLHNQTKTVSAGTYILSEDQLPGYSQTGLTCAGNSTPLSGSSITVKVGENVTCTFTNNDVAPTLTLVKHVTNDNGGVATANQWTLTAVTPGGPDRSALTGQTVTVRGGVVYTIGEYGGPAGYALTELSCDSGKNATVQNPYVTLNPGEHVTCTLTNNDIAPKLTLRKVVVNDNGGAAVPTDWNGRLIATMGSASTFLHNQTKDVAAGTYTLSEDQLNGYTRTGLVCAGNSTALNGSALTLKVGEDVTCTFTNNDEAPTLTLVKTVVNNDGGTATAGQWTLTATSASGPNLSVTSGNGGGVAAGAAYTIGENSGPAGYTLTNVTCDTGKPTTLGNPTVTLNPGEDVTCVLTNNDVAPTLTLVKSVVNNDGGTKVPADWNGRLIATSGSAQTYLHNQTRSVSAGAYALTEQQVSGYTQTSLNCVGNSTEMIGVTVTLRVGENVTCTYVNDDVAPRLTLLKEVINDDNGTAEADDWMLEATAPGGTRNVAVRSGDGPTQVNANAPYTLAEVDGPSGYTQVSLSCDNGHISTTRSVPVVTLLPGENVTCTYVNDDEPGNLTLVKDVTNDDGGTMGPADWDQRLRATGDTVLLFDSGETQEVAPGTYAIDELQLAGYEMTGSVFCEGNAEEMDGDSVFVGNGEDVVCTIYNDDIAPRLTLIKEVDNTNGGSAEPGDWTLNADASGAPSMSVTSGDSATVKANVEYTLSEDGPAGYEHTALRCDNGITVSVANPKITLGVGMDVTCTFSNASELVPLTLIKEVDNSNGGILPATSWTLTATNDGANAINGPGVLQEDGSAHISGMVKSETPYTLSETGPAGYTASDWYCETTEGDELTLEEGAVSIPTGLGATCVILNTSIAAMGTVSKTVASTTQNTDGTWTVVYTVTVANPSTTATYTYDLQDTLVFGAGITINSASWSGEGRSGSFSGGTATLANDEVVPVSDTHVYTVTVNATVTLAAIEEETITCIPSREEEEGSGFLNTVRLTGTFVRAPIDAEACAEPILPRIYKGGLGVTKNDDGSYKLEYLVSIVSPVTVPATTIIRYDVTDMPTLPASLMLDGVWTATPRDGAPEATNPTWNGVGTWNLITDGQLDAESPAHQYIVSANVILTGEPLEVEECYEWESSGIVVWNSAEITSGEYVASDEGCVVFDRFDVGIVKTAVLGDKTSVEVGDSFIYELLVTNYSSEISTVEVTDTDLPDGLSIDDLEVDGAVTWSPAPGYSAAGVMLTIEGLAPNASATLRLHVTWEPEGTSVTPLTLDNTACVAMEGDENADNDCDTETVPVKQPVPPTPKPPLAFTGAEPSSLPLVIAGFALIIGVALVRTRRNTAD